MSRAVLFDPVCENQTTDIAARPPMINAVSVPYNPICRQFSGTQTATPPVPETH